MLHNVTTLTQRHPIGDFGYAVISEPDDMMRMPPNTEKQPAPLASPVNADVEMSPLLSGEIAIGHDPFPTSLMLTARARLRLTCTPCHASERQSSGRNNLTPSRATSLIFAAE